jgi:pimeloyl-ACP methyl ester carboxylesterase
MAQSELQRMAASLRAGRYAVVEGAGHNLHLDRPDAWRTVVERFLVDLGVHHRPCRQDTERAS